MMAVCAPCLKARVGPSDPSAKVELVLVMFATGMLGMVVISGDREKDVRAIVSVLHEIGVEGLNLEIVMDNESSPCLR